MSGTVSFLPSFRSTSATSERNSPPLSNRSKRSERW